MKKVILLFFFVTFYQLYSQDSKLYFETGFDMKVSIGEPTFQQISGYRYTADVYQQLSYDYPVYQLCFSGKYLITEKINIGITSGINVLKYHYYGEAYSDKVGIPLYFTLGSKLPLKKDWHFLTDINVGYQFIGIYQNYSFIDEVWQYQQSGGIMAGIDIGVYKSTKKYSPSIKLGYEFNRFENIEHLGVEIDNRPLEKVVFYSYCHLLKIGLSIKI